jgi:GTP-binding protein
MYEYLKAYNLPTLVVATKYDKVKPSMRKKNENMIKHELSLAEEDLFLTFSAETKHNLGLCMNSWKG